MPDFSIRRRDFVAGATAVATGVVLTPESFASGDHSLYNLTYADFVGRTGESFLLEGTTEHGARQRGTMVLKQVIRHPTSKNEARPAHVRGEGFSLSFESRDVAVASGTHLVACDGLAPRAVYLQEMLEDRQPGQRRYEAVFN